MKWFNAFLKNRVLRVPIQHVIQYYMLDFCTRKNLFRRLKEFYNQKKEMKTELELCKFFYAKLKIKKNEIQLKKK